MATSPRARLWVESMSEGELEVTGERAHYLRHVLRLESGDQVTLTSGDGYLARATILVTTRDTVTLAVGAKVAAARTATKLTLGVAPPKGERADWLVEKITELGVERLLWLHTERTVVLPKHGERAKRWQRLAEAAAKQSGRAAPLFIEGPIPFAELLRREASRRYIADASGACLFPKLVGARPRDALLLVGPEGGFTAAELTSAIAAGYAVVALGVHTLRVETAAVTGAALILSAADSREDGG